MGVYHSQSNFATESSPISWTFENNLNIRLGKVDKNNRKTVKQYSEKMKKMFL